MDDLHAHAANANVDEQQHGGMVEGVDSRATVGLRKDAHRHVKIDVCVYAVYKYNDEASTAARYEASPRRTRSSAMCLYTCLSDVSRSKWSHVSGSCVSVDFGPVVRAQAWRSTAAGNRSDETAKDVRSAGPTSYARLPTSRADLRRAAVTWVESRVMSASS